MPIKIQDDLPAKSVLEDEHIFVMTETRALSQDIRPLKIVILNLMPTKIETETQILRRLSNTPLQIEITLLQTATHESKNVSEEHMIAFYQEFDQIKDENYDGMIITGMSYARLWSGVRHMCILPSIFAGVPRQGFIIITVFRSIFWTRRFPAYFPIKC